MKILIGIATYQRTGKLQRCLDSIKASNYWNYEIVVVADNSDQATDQYLSANKNLFWDVVVQDRQGFVIGGWNRIVKDYFNDMIKEWESETTFVEEPFDAFLGLVDDVELSEDTLEKAVQAHRFHFPDGDGVVGLHQTCPGHPEYTFKWYGQTLMGRKFIERYREVDYQICCPYYKWSHQDEEMFQYANSLGKFKECPEASLRHYHPSFIAGERDSTHDIVRFGSDSPKLHDLQVFADRQKRGLIWGKDWEA